METRKDFRLLIGSKMPTSVALISDTHIGGRIESPFKIKITYQIISDYGITDVFHLGDFFDFDNNPNDKNYNRLLERYIFEKAIERAVLSYPKISSIKTHIVQGGHDVMTGEHLDQKCMIDQLCKYRPDFINITSKDQLDPEYLNFHSDIYYCENIDFLFRHSERENINLTPTSKNICISLIGHYHEYFLNDSNNYRIKRPQPNEYKIYAPSLSANNHTKDVDFIIIEIREEEIIVKPMSLVDNGPVLDKVRVIKRT